MPSQAATRSICTLLRVALLAAAGLLSSAATARDFEIRYHERVELTRTNDAGRVSFVAYGRQFDLILESNAGIVASPNPAAAPGIALYRGSLAGHANSWVRLSESNGESNGRLAGAIWDGTEIWLVESRRRLAEYFLNPDAAPANDNDSDNGGGGGGGNGNDNVIFRLSEVSGSLGDVVVSAIEPKPATAFASIGPQPGRILDVGLVAATDFAERHGSQARDVLLEMFNVVEGIFITQVGVQLRATEISILESTPGDLQEKDPETLLQNFGAYKTRNSDLYPLGLAHLFVSRDLDDLHPPTRTVGMANLGVLCDRNFGVGITQATHATILDALIAAHEIGHNFGAPHDAEADSRCEAESNNFIMAPKISGSTRFSQCSLEAMQPEILGAGCMREIPPTDLQLTLDTPPPAHADERQTLGLDMVLSNVSNAHVAGVELSAASTGFSGLSVNIDAIEDGYCEGSSLLRCVWPWFPAGASVMLNLSATADVPGPGSIDVSVDSLHELDPSDNTLRFDIEIHPLADLLSMLTPASAALHPGESKRFEAAVSNRGNRDAHGVVAHVSIDGALELTDIELPNCVAQDTPEQTVYACPIGTLSAHRAWSFGFSVAVPPDADTQAIAQQPAASVSVFATSDVVTPDDADRRAQATVTIGESINDLGVTIDGPRLIEIGQPAAWKIEVVNHGPDTAVAVHVFDGDASRMLPSTAVNIEASIGDCALSGSNTEFDCSIAVLGVGETATITLSATPTQVGRFYWLEAAAQSLAPDGNPGNNQTSLLVAAGNGDSGAAPDSTAAGSNAAKSEDSGGGGSSGLLTLLYLCALPGLTALRRRYRS